LFDGSDKGRGLTGASCCQAAVRSDKRKLLV
jgi:hypothetical protein